MKKIILSLILMVLMTFSVCAVTTFTDDFSSGNAYDNGWSAVSGTMVEAGGIISSQDTSNALIEQNFTNVSWTDDWNITLDLGLSFPVGADGTQIYLTNENGTSPVNYLTLKHFWSVPNSSIAFTLECAGSCNCTSSGIILGANDDYTLKYESSSDQIFVYRNNILRYNTSLSSCDLDGMNTMLMSKDSQAILDNFVISSFVSKSIYEQTPTGWHIYENFDTQNTDMYYFDTTSTRTPDEFYCNDGGGGFLVINDSFKVDPKGELLITANYSTGLGNDQNSWGLWMMQNYNDTGVQSISNATTKFVQVWHRNRGADTAGSQALRLWNGTYLYNGDDGWASNNNEGIKAPSIMTYNLTVLPNGSYSLEFYDNGGLEDSYISSLITTDDFIGESDYFLNFDCRKGTANSQLIMDSFEIYYTAPAYQNVAPEIVPSSPANNTDTNQNLSVQMTVTDDNSSTTDCDLYVDTILNQSNVSVLNNTLTTFPMVWSQGLHTWYLECEDGENATTTTGTYNLYFDDHEPNIVSGSPSITTTTIYTGFTMNLFGNVINLNLTNVTRIILYPNSTQFYVNETTSFVNATFLGWNEVFNTTLEPSGVWTYSIYAEDVLQNHSHYYSFTVNNCVPDWSCDGFGSCNESDLSACVSATDGNTCGLPFGTLGENLSDFAPQACDFCNDDTSITSSTTCDSVSDTQNNTYTDANFGACCNVTGITTDCGLDVVRNASVFTLTEVCSIFDYDEGDLSLALFDTIGKFILSFSMFIMVVVVVVILSFKSVQELWRKFVK